MAPSIASTDSGGQSSGGFTAPAPDPDIAGIGVGLRKRSPLFIKVEEKVLGFSDQILITGFGLQLAGFIKLEGLSIYHQAIITFLATMSTSCHSLSVIILRKYFHTHALARQMRIGVMTISMLLLTANIIILQVGPGFVTSMEPAFQIYAPPGQPSYSTLYNQEVALLGAFIGLLALSLTLIIFWYTCSYLTFPNSHDAWLNPSAPGTGIIIEVELRRRLAALCMWFIPFLPLSPVFTSLLPYFLEIGFIQWGPAGGATGGTSERSWGYGQITPLLFLLLPILNAVSIYSGEKINETYFFRS
ncbi:hypothetical protein BKA61DRAFT_656047 [Leptodontidium sp. MPI-SDFR-AT-0119]|nr:hypothetical protein BKA61DRAFT_656047 [Leptodontidium sp. MPI-SDFR-AT-0119]